MLWWTNKQNNNHITKIVFILNTLPITLIFGIVTVPFNFITSFLHAWTRVVPREIFKYSRSVFAWTTKSRGVEHTRLVYHHAWLLHARLLHAWPLHAWLLHTWLAITRVAGYYTSGWLLTSSCSNRWTITGTEYPQEYNETIRRLASIDKRGITLALY